MYELWLFLSRSEYRVNHSFACSNNWETAQLYLDLRGVVCEEELKSVDYNNDGYCNFREFVSSAYHWIYSGKTQESIRMKAPQVNCSACTSMQYYNI